MLRLFYPCCCWYCFGVWLSFCLTIFIERSAAYRKCQCTRSQNCLTLTLDCRLSFASPKRSSHYCRERDFFITFSKLLSLTLDCVWLSVLVHFNEKSFRLFYPTPYDRNTIWPNAIWPNAIWPKVHLTESSLTEHLLTERYFYEKDHLADFISKGHFC
jgi:hypothetical protein